MCYKHDTDAVIFYGKMQVFQQEAPQEHPLNLNGDGGFIEIFEADQIGPIMTLMLFSE